VGRRRGAVAAIYDARECREDGGRWAALQLCCCKSGGRLCRADSQGREAERSSGLLSPKFEFVIDLKTAGQPAFALEQLQRLEWRGQRRGNPRSLPAMRTKLEPPIPDPITVISIRKIY